jgi:PAS domain S-box-containing protein
MNPLSPSPSPQSTRQATGAFLPGPPACEHAVQFYEEVGFLSDAVARFLGDGLSAGEPLVVIATEMHRQLFVQRLKSSGFDVEGACGDGRLTLLDAAQTLSTFMVGDMPDWERFRAHLGGVLEKSSAAGPGRRVRAYGEMVELLWREGRPQAALRLEEFWNDLGRIHLFTLLCAYSMAGFSQEAQGEQFRQVCGHHSHVHPTESYSPGDDLDARLRQVSFLQQRARALETELQHRKALEESLRTTLNELHQSQRELKDFVENAVEGLHWVGPDGIVLWANKAEFELLGYSKDEYIGRHIAEFHADRAVIEDMLARLAGNETLRDYEARLRCKDGSIKHVLINSNVAWEDGQFRHTRCFTRDNTARKHAQDALIRLQSITARLSEARTTKEVVEVIVRQGAEAVGALTSAVFLLDREGGGLELARAVGYPKDVLERYSRLPLSTPLPMAEAVRHATPVFLPSRDALERYPDIRYAIDASRAASIACAPLMVEGKPIGVLGFGVRRTLDDEQRALVVALANQGAQALDRAHLYEAESRSRRQAETAQRRTAFLSDVSALLSSSLDYETTLASVARMVVPRIADWCIVELANDPRAPSIPIVVEHVDASKVQTVREYRRRFPPDPHATRGVAHVIKTGTPELSPSVSDELREVDSYPPEQSRLLRELGVQSTIIVPMPARGRMLGAIVLMTSDSGRRFEQADLGMAEELGRRAALAIDNARLYHEARQANRRKDEFLAMLGHELRNPLAPILTALELMQLRGMGGAREQKIIERQVKHLVRLVDDLLDVSRITRGKVELKKEPIELSVVLAKAIEMASPLYEQRSHRLSVDVTREGLLVEADPVRLAQVLANLLTNAAKYTEPGGQVVVTARREHGELVVSVKDNGMGISSEMLSSVFELFVQGERTLDRSQGGLGIGLTVARSLVELHGGTISARSPGLGQGSEFLVRLPALAKPVVHEEAPAGTLQLSSPPPLSGVRVLLVDDNKDAVEVLAELLQTYGHEVAVAYDGPQALTMAPMFRPHAALLDIGLPVMDGYELAKRLREVSAGHPSRLVAVTGYGQDSDKAKSREAGFDVHLVKPVDLSVILPLLADLAVSEHQDV